MYYPSSEQWRRLQNASYDIHGGKTAELLKLTVYVERESFQDLTGQKRIGLLLGRVPDQKFHVDLLHA